MAKKKQHPLIKKYLESDFAKNFKLVGKGNRKVFCSTMGRRPGIHRTLKKRFYPDYRPLRRKKKVMNRGSSKKKGTAVDNAITKYAETGKLPRHRLAKTLVKYWTITLGHTIEITQLPVNVTSLGCLTQADVITKNSDNELFIWEVKTGKPALRRIKDRTKLRGTNIESVPNNHAHLQCHYTWMGVKDALKIPQKNVFVVRAWEKHKKGKKVELHVEAYKHPTWLKRFQ